MFYKTEIKYAVLIMIYLAVLAFVSGWVGALVGWNKGYLEGYMTCKTGK